MALVVHALGSLHKALIVSTTCLFACGGSALEGPGPDSAGEVEVDTIAEVEAETAEVETTDAEVTEVDVDTLEVETDIAETEVEVGPTDWEPVSLGDEGGIDDLVLVDAGRGFAASGTRVLRWDGQLWGAYGAPGAGAVHGVWADAEVAVSRLTSTGER